MAYWATSLARHISLDSLNWIGNTINNTAAYPNTRFYTFINPGNKYMYMYYINADNTDLNLNLDSIKLTGYNLDSTVYREYFSVKNNYSTAGYSQGFEHNKFYKVGNNWQTLLANEPAATYLQVAVSAKNYNLKRKSIGYIKIPLKVVGTGINETDALIKNIAFYPNPTNGIVTISALSNINADIKVSKHFRLYHYEFKNEWANIRVRFKGIV
ncbi:MAG: hypothetical protein IPG08_06785 [Sphingobacteriaceae bacterium]|nr:hypothetical protein [Sphingobacteriaceae bacterium]